VSPSTTTARRLGCAIALSLALTTGLAACSTSSSSSSAPSTDAAGQLTKAATITRLDAVCLATDTKLRALPQAKNRQDYAALLTDFSSTGPIFDAYFAQVTPLVAQSVDRDKLTTKWLAVEKDDYARQQPLVNDMISALQAKNDSSISAVEKQLEKVTVHTGDIVGFFRQYGLHDCADMQSGSNTG
jgi:hypothetical protein